MVSVQQSQLAHVKFQSKGSGFKSSLNGEKRPFVPERAGRLNICFVVVVFLGACAAHLQPQRACCVHILLLLHQRIHISRSYRSLCAPQMQFLERSARWRHGAWRLLSPPCYGAELSGVGSRVEWLFWTGSSSSLPLSFVSREK